LPFIFLKLRTLGQIALLLAMGFQHSSFDFENKPQKALYTGITMSNAYSFILNPQLTGTQPLSDTFANQKVCFCERKR